MHKVESEKRLRTHVKALLDLVNDSADNKKLEKTCTALHSEFPNSHLACSAVAICYHKLGHFSAAKQLCQTGIEQMRSWISDSATGIYYASCLKSLNEYELLERLWETATTLEPGNMSHYDNLFTAAIRSGNTKKQLEVANKLLKITSDEMYLLWSIVARVLPELDAPIPRASSITESIPNVAKTSIVLQLSQKMFENGFLDKGKVKKQLELGFYLRILIQQGNLTKALETIRSEVAKKVYGIEYQRLNEEAALLLRLGKSSPESQDSKTYLTQASEIYKSLIENHNSDEWSWYQGYFEALNINENTTDESFKAVLEFLNNLKTKNPRVRSCLLSFLELSVLSHRYDLLQDYASNYFSTFSAKPSCFGDLKPYLKFFKKNGVEFIKSISSFENIKIPTFSSNTSSDTIYDIQAISEPEKAVSLMISHANLESLRMVLISFETSEDYNKQIEHLWNLYNASRNINIPREQTEHFCGDEFLLIIAHCHCQLARLHLDSSVLSSDIKNLEINSTNASHKDDYTALHVKALSEWNNAAVTLRYGLRFSRYYFQYRLLLNEVYIAMGAVRGCIEQFDPLAIKHIQFDSVGYLWLDALFRYNISTDISSIVKKSIQFYSESHRSTADWALEAFKKGAYHKIQEVLDLDKRLRHSIHLSGFTIEGFWHGCSQATTLANLITHISSFMSTTDVSISQLNSTTTKPKAAKQTSSSGNKGDKKAGKQQKQPESSAVSSSTETLNLATSVLLPTTLQQANSLFKNQDLGVMDWRGPHEVSPNRLEYEVDGLIHSCTYPDELQSLRILVNVYIIHIAQHLAFYQSHSLSVKDLEVLLGQFDTEALGSNKFSKNESLMWKIISSAVSSLIQMSKIGPELSADNPVEDSSLETLCTSLNNTYAPLIDLCNNTYSMFDFSSRASFLLALIQKPIVILMLIIPLIQKLMPGKSRPKTPDSVKKQVSTLKQSVNTLIETLKTFFIETEKKLSHIVFSQSSLDSALDSSLYPYLQKFAQQDNESNKNLIIFSFKDTTNTLVSLLKNRLNDLPK